MSNSTKGLVTKSYLENIADAIREKTGSSSEMMVSEMSGNILEIPSVTPTGTIDIVANGSYDVATYGTAHVAVPSVSPTGSYDITENGSYDIADYAKVNVEVPQGVFPTGTYPIAGNGSYDVTNYAEVRVLVPGPTGSYDVTANGSYDITNYAKVNVEVPSPLPADTGLYFLPYETQGSAGFIPIVGWEEGEDWKGRYVQLGSATCNLLSESAIVVDLPGDAYIYYPGFISGDNGFVEIDGVEEAGDTIWVTFGSNYADACPSSKVIYDESLPDMQEGEMTSAYAGENGFVLVRTSAGPDAVIYNAQIPDMQVGDSISVTEGYGNYHYTLTRNA